MFVKVKKGNKNSAFRLSRPQEPRGEVQRDVLPYRSVGKGTDVSWPACQPEFLGLESGSIQNAAVVYGNDPVPVTMENKDRHRRNFFYPFHRAVVVAEQKRQRVLERPGDKKARQLPEKLFLSISPGYSSR